MNHNRSNRLQTKRALTLLEVMMVTVLIAMVASVTMVSLGGTDRAARTMSIIGQLKDLDARARLLSQTSGSRADMMLDDQWLSLISNASKTSEAASEAISQIKLGTVALQLATDHPVQHISFDRCGRSPDYTVTLSDSDSVRRWTVYGLTGEWREMERSP